MRFEDNFLFSETADASGQTFRHTFESLGGLNGDTHESLSNFEIKLDFFYLEWMWYPKLHFFRLKFPSKLYRIEGKV
jgi:hypothetical protein